MGWILMSPTCAETTLTDVVESVRRGGVVRVSVRSTASEAKSPAGYFVLAAEMASTDVLHRLLRFADSLPVVRNDAAIDSSCCRSWRCRLPTSAMANQIGKPPTTRGRPIENRPARGWLAAAAASLVGSDAEVAKDALRGLTVRCTDWGGVANCQRIFEAAVDLAPDGWLDARRRRLATGGRARRKPRTCRCATNCSTCRPC